MSLGNKIVWTMLALFLISQCAFCLSVGQTGPAGGIIVYDKGRISDGWQYIEASPKPLEGLYLLEDEGVDGTATEIGSGRRNTSLIAQLFAYEQNAAYACRLFSLEQFSDWHLPSLDELELVYKAVGKTYGKALTDQILFCTSSEACDSTDDAGYSWLMDFSSGRKINTRRNSQYHVWPVRYF